MPSPAGSPPRRLVDRVIGAISVVAVAALVVMIAATLLQVVMRYGLRAPPVWTEELARYAMIWAGLLGAVAAFYYRADPVLIAGWSVHVDWRGRVAGLCRAVGVTLFLGPVVWYGIFGAGLNVDRGFLARSAGRQAEMLGIPMIWVTAVVPVALCAIVGIAWIQAVTRKTPATSAGQGPLD
jgi:TRAP-type C4-dicarboxylate transport system permease small subunit